jgi:glycerol-3-phosphate acyltransferase PlsY
MARIPTPFTSLEDIHFDFETAKPCRANARTGIQQGVKLFRLGSKEKWRLEKFSFVVYTPIASGGNGNGNFRPIAGFLESIHLGTFEPAETLPQHALNNRPQCGKISDNMSWLLITALSYLIGSVPWGFVFARVKGVDIRQKGSGNIGAANATRVMGRKWGYLVFLCDFLKGYFAVELGLLIAGFFRLDPVFASVLAATASVIGHDYPVWLGFKGGKGIATLAGVVLGVFPPLVCVSYGVVWGVVFLLGRYTSLASICAVVALPVAAALIVAKNEAGFPLLVGFCIFMAVLALWRHRSNIVRLLNGTENRFGKK